MIRRLPNGRGIAVIAGLCLSVGACSSGADDAARANDLAIRACTAQTIQSREGFNPQVASISDLSKLAETAMHRSELADQAAALNERWLLLSEVSATIAAFAQQLLEVREEGTKEQDAISLSMWDDYKTASNTYLTECQSALKNVSGSLPDIVSEVTALMSIS